MNLIKLGATGSTNSYLKDLLANSNPGDLTVVYAEDQFSGRGQLDREWVSEPGKNLTFSILKKFDSLRAREQFRVNMIVSLSICRVLDELGVPGVAIKWPNDILSGKGKLAGILIEVSLRGDQLINAVIGIGLNVNQKQFPNLPNATSLALILERDTDREELLKKIHDQLRDDFKRKGTKPLGVLKEEYETRLFGKGEKSFFIDQKGKRFSAEVMGVSNDGRLELELDNDTRGHFTLKELKWDI